MHSAEKLAAMALSGITVLDLTRLLPGAFCSQIMADFGADVIKIEHPVGGDYNRSFQPINKIESGSFLLLNRNKRSVAIDLKAPEGKAAFLRLVRTADVVLEGFRPGVMERLGLDYETLSGTNPGIIYCAISGYGQDGPMKFASGHDINYLAMAGALPLFGESGRDPIVPGLSIADVGGGSLMASTGIMAALIARGKTGKGQFVDISMFDGAVSWLSYHGADYLFGGIEPRGGERPFIGQAACYNVYRCADGKHVALGIIEEHFWWRFCDAIGMPELKSQQWPVDADAVRQREKLVTLFAAKPRDMWLEFFADIDIPFSPVLSMEEAFSQPHFEHRKMLMKVQHPVEGDVHQLGFPIKLSGTPATLRSPPPVLGQHTAEVLSAISYSPSDIERLQAAGVVKCG